MTTSRPSEYTNGKVYSDYTEANRATWNLWVTRDTDTDHYKDAERFRVTGSSLRPIELAELDLDGSPHALAGNTLLHLQCNLGSETLSWARLGARVTGVDISDAAISYAERLAEESGLSEQARFIRSDIYALPEALDEQFDVVVATYGALCWAPDLPGWARVAARYVAPGGTLLLVELHPLGMALGVAPDDPTGRTLHVEGRYFHHVASSEATEAPETAEAAGEAPVYAWSYGVGEVVTALTANGLRVESLREFPYAHWRQFPQLVASSDGYWRWPDSANELPLLFALRATRPTADAQR